MAINRYERSAATVSWIDPATGLPEVDEVKPNGPTATRPFLTGNAGFRFCNFIEGWMTYDTVARRITGFDFTLASKLYRAPSFLKIPSHVFPQKTSKMPGADAVTFTQIVGARTESPEIIGGTVGGAVGGTVAGPIGQRVGGYIGEKAARRVSGFPPIWSELKLKIFNDGRFEVNLLQHSLFPSLTLYKVRLDGANQSQSYDRVSIVGASYYNAIPSLEKWKEEGWGPIRGATLSGPTPGNPWEFKK